MPLSLKTMEGQIKGNQWNKRFRTVRVYCGVFVRKSVAIKKFIVRTDNNWCGKFFDCL